MRIGIDARELTGRPTGVGRYLVELVTRWTRSPEAAAHELVLYVPGTGTAVPESIHDAVAPPESNASFRHVAGQPGLWWEQVRLPKAASSDDLDRFFAPAYSSPLAIRLTTVLTIHDLSFQAHPEWFTWREGLRRRLATRLAARQAARILTDTEFSRAQITELLGISPSRIQVIPLGAPPVDPCLRETGDEREPLVLFVGSIFARRRLPDLLRAFALVARAHPEVRLVLVGEDRSHPRVDLAGLAATLDVSGRVMMTKYLPDDQLARLYGRARVFVFLSEYEGFGLTPLEALAAGVPVIALDTPVTREVYENAAVLVAPNDIEGTAAAIVTLLFDEDVRGRQQRAATRLLARYSWDRAARDTLAAILTSGESSPR